jgi:hypothetical protein
LLHYECSSARCCVSAAVLGCEEHAAIPHHFYLPVLTPCDFFFLGMKLQLQEHHFMDIPEIQEELLLYA